MEKLKAFLGYSFNFGTDVHNYCTDHFNRLVGVADRILSCCDFLRKLITRKLPDERQRKIRIGFWST